MRRMMNAACAAALFLLSGIALASAQTGPANRVYATPNGSAGQLGIRALVGTDLPIVPLDKGGLGGSQAGATMGQVPVFPGGGGPAVPTNLPDITNRFTNSQFLVSTGYYANQTKQNIIGSGTVNTFNVTSYSTGSPVITVNLSGVPNPNGPEVGQLVQFGAGCDASMGVGGGANGSPLRVLSVTGTPATAITVLGVGGTSPSVTGTCMAVLVSQGDYTGVSANAADGWERSGSGGFGSFWIDDWAVNLLPGTHRSLAFKKLAAADLNICQTLPPDIAKSLLGQTITENFQVKQGTKGGSGTSHAYFDIDGAITAGSSAAGAGGFENLTATVTVPTNATTIKGCVAQTGNINDVYYVAHPHLAIAPSLPAGYYSQPRSERVIPIVWASLWSYIPNTYTFPAVTDGIGEYSVAIDLYAESNGRYHYALPIVDLYLEWAPATAPGAWLAIRSPNCSPIRKLSGPTAYGNIAGVNATSEAPAYTGPLQTWNGATCSQVSAQGFVMLWTHAPGLNATAVSINAYGAQVSQ